MNKVVVIGASAAGLAAGRCLREAGVDAELIEQNERVAGAWRRHYDRLHLHTPKSGSQLPYLAMPAAFDKYPARDDVIDYLERYAKDVGQPIRFGERVSRIARDGSGWVVESTSGTRRATHVVIATGNTRIPFRPVWPGMDTFRGDILHSADYRNGSPYKGQRVLVVGFGNSACEIALCLHEHGALPTLSVREAVNVIPRDVLGIPVLSIGILQRFLPTKLADWLNAPLLRLTVGDITKLGLRRLPYGPATQIQQTGKVPLLDIGTIALIRAGSVHVRPGIEAFTPDGVHFTDGREEPFAAVVLGTGYRPQLEDFLADEPDDRMHFCGFYVSPAGMLREIGIEARRIAKRIARDLRAA